MGWPAVSRFGLLVLFACAHETPVPVANHIDPAPTDPSGAYWCSIDESGFAYTRMPCMIKKLDGHFVLAKLGGSQRFTGVITPDGEGFKFVGKLYCPWGNCTQALHGSFRPIAHNELEGKFTDDPMTVRLAKAPAGAFGGDSYGGDGYGGDPWSIAR